jgi:hypothetical protein
LKFRELVTTFGHQEDIRVVGVFVIISKSAHKVSVVLFIDWNMHKFHVSSTIFLSFVSNFKSFDSILKDGGEEMSPVRTITHKTDQKFCISESVFSSRCIELNDFIGS